MSAADWCLAVVAVVLALCLLVPLVAAFERIMDKEDRLP